VPIIADFCRTALAKLLKQSYLMAVAPLRTAMFKRDGAARSGTMSGTFKVGDHVSWNSEAGRVSGKIVKVHTRDTNYKGYVHHASGEEPQYEIKSDKTDHVALHKGSALRHLR
jgi:hypothetical protein